MTVHQAPHDPQRDRAKAPQVGEETGGMHLGPAVLWGILISECGERRSDEDEEEYETEDKYRAECGYEAEDGSAEAPTSWISHKGPNKAEGQSFAKQKACPAILWGILLSETPPHAIANKASNLPVLDMKATIDLWIAAGYDCQLPTEDAASRPGTTTTASTADSDETLTQYTAPPGPYSIHRSAGKGLGVFATRDLAKGERILVDKPFLTVPKPYSTHSILAAFEALPFAARRQYMRLHCPARPDAIHLTDVTRIFEANSFNIGAASALFRTATRFNHSCLPNTYYSWRSARGEIVFHSMRDTPRDTELTISYGAPFSSRRDRRSQLRIYDFACRCAACEPDTPFGRASEARRLEMCDLDGQIARFHMDAGACDPLPAILRLIELVREEGLSGELMTPCRDAADWLKGRGRFEEALKFTRLELEEEVVSLGGDSEVVAETAEYIAELERIMGDGNRECKSTEEIKDAHGARKMADKQPVA